jgi:hypothetical protein
VRSLVHPTTISAVGGPRRGARAAPDGPVVHDLHGPATEGALDQGPVVDMVARCTERTR